MPINSTPVFLTQQGGGFNVIGMPGTNEFGHKLLLLPDGKILVIGGHTNGTNLSSLGGPVLDGRDFMVSRFNADGTLDTSYGVNGISITSSALFAGVVSTADPRAAALQPDGKLVVAGYAWKGVPNNYQFALARYNADGSLDTSFDGDGVATSALHARADQINSVTVLSTGKILVAGYSQTASSANTRDFELARYNADGSLDTGFDGDGWLTTVVSAFFQDRANAIQVLASGKILLLGQSNSASNVSDAALVQYNDDGTLDTGFGTGGKLVLPTSNSDHSASDTWNSLHVQSDGKIVILGAVTTGRGDGSTSLTLMRLNANGTVDSTFNGDGNADGTITTPLLEFLNIGYRVIEQSDGKYLVSGLSFYNSFSNYGVLIRYNHDGSLDTSFGTDGVVFSPFPVPADTSYQDVAVQPDGKIVVTGFRGAAEALDGYDAIVVRYNADGTLDTSFGESSPNTMLTYTMGTDPVLLAPSLMVYDAEFAADNGGLGNYGGATLTLVRHGGANADDIFEESGALTTTNLSGSSGTLLLHGTTFGTFAEGASGLVITVAAGTTQARIDEAVHLIAYKNVSNTTDNVQIDLTFSDGNTSITASSFVEISQMPQINYDGRLVDEAVGIVEVEVRLDHASSSPVTVNYATADGTGVAGQDYTATSGSLTFQPGETSKTVSVTILNDAVNEGVEYFLIDFTNLVGAADDEDDDSISPILIAQNDAPTVATPTITAAQVGTHESDHNVTFVVSLSAPSTQTVTVNYATATQSAGAGDFTAVSGTFTFLPGETTKVLEVETTQDFLSESTETFTLNLSSALNASIGSPSIMATILDDDPGLSTGLALNGTDGPDVLLGTYRNDTLIGGLGNDLLIGDEGNDSALGGAGDDLYSVDDAGFTIVEASNEGNDTALVKDLSTYTLPANVENLVMFAGTPGFTLAVSDDEGSFTLDRVESTSSPLVGTWTIPWNDQGGIVAITFFEDGTYMLAEDGDPLDDPTGQDGMERGTYTWNQSNGAFTKTAPTVDTNGQWGLSHTTITSMHVQGDTLLVDTASEGTIAFSRVVSETNPLVGSWYVADAGLAVITIMADGTYVMAEDGNSLLDPSGQDGMERGTYTWNPATGAFTHTTTVDTNGEWGLSHGSAATLTVLGSTGIGNALDNRMTGNAAANSLSASSGNDTLQGGLGNDTLDGGDGNDTAVFNSAFAVNRISVQVGNSDLIVSGPDGVDTLRNIEILQFTDHTYRIQQGSGATESISGGESSDLIRGRDGNDTVTGGGGDDALYGDEGVDTIDGGTGDDFLDGGTGGDNMAGGTGDDTYVVDSASDVIVETNGVVGLLKDPLADNPGGGIDTVISSINFTLGSFLENLQLVLNAGHLNGTGNSLANILSGNNQNNLLTGGAGDDTLEGGDGVDTAGFAGVRGLYIVNTAGATPTVSGEGTDTLRQVERLQFSDGRVAIDMQGSGGSTAKLVGALFGSAAIGDATLVGQYLAQFDAGMGNEEVAAAAVASARFAQAAGSHSNAAFVNFVYQNVAGVAPDQGTFDLLTGLLASGVFTQASMALAAADFVQVGNLVAYNLQEASVVAGTESGETLTGTAAANFIFGRGGNDVLSGLAGNDLISGGAGIDRAVYTTAKSASAVVRNDLGLLVTTGAETDQLVQVERITHTNISVAWDISGNAGSVAKIIGAIFGPAALQEEALVGQYLAMLDSGMSYEAVTGAAAASARFGTEAGGHSNAQFVDRVYFNIAGILPSADVAAPLVALLDTPGYSQAYLGSLAADVSYNVANVNLTGLAVTGLEYTVI